MWLLQEDIETKITTFFSEESIFLWEGGDRVFGILLSSKRMWFYLHKNTFLKIFYNNLQNIIFPNIKLLTR